MTDFKTPLINAGFTGDLYVPGDEGYEASLVRFAKNAQKRAGLVAFVKSAQDVARVIIYATSNGIPIVVRGGGHSTSGASSSEGGIVIDLSRHLNTVRIDTENKLGYVDAGANWEAVDKEAIKYGLATVGGTVNHTGVGGLTLGGGYGWLSGKFGMTIDNLQEATLVTAAGEIITVSNDSHPDLFWAIRGGGPNFGVVVEFVYRLHEQHKMVFAGRLIYPPPLLGKIVDTMQAIYEKGEEDTGMMLVTVSKTPPPPRGTGGPGVVVVVFYNSEEEAEGIKRFQSLIDLGPVMNLTGMIPYEALNALQNPTIPYGANYHLNGVTRGPAVSGTTAEQVFNTLVATANKPSAIGDVVPTMAIIWEFHALKKQCSVAPDAMAFRMRIPCPISTLIITWDGEGEDPAIAASISKEMKERLSSFKAFAKDAFKDAEDVKDDTGYTNYEMGNVGSTDAAKVIFGDNYPRLQDVKKKYDPNMIFKSWYPIQPAA